MYEVEQAYRAGGEQAAQTEMLRLQGELFTKPGERSRVEARWQESRRWPVLKDILASHDAGFYGTSVPAAIAQAEGIIAEGMKHRGKMHSAVYEKLLDRLFKDDDLSNPLVKRFRMKLMTHFEHGDDAPEFSRHAILHGGDWSYGTVQNSIRALAWLDCLLCALQTDADSCNISVGDHGDEPELGLRTPE